jgi:hypothetical protein
VNTIVLDDFPAWSIYIPATIVLLVFLLALSLLLARLRSAPNAQFRNARKTRSNRPLWLFLIGSGAALWFMAASMFLRFHAVGIDRSQIQLIYLWPEPPVSIDYSELIDVKLTRAGRNCGHLELATQQERYLSVNFRKCDSAEALIKQIPLRVVR